LKRIFFVEEDTDQSPKRGFVFLKSRVRAKFKIYLRKIEIEIQKVNSQNYSLIFFTVFLYAKIFLKIFRI